MNQSLLDNKKENSLLTFQKISAVFFLIFCLEMMIGCDGHWLEIPVGSFDLSIRMINFALLLLGYLFYVIFYRKWKDELNLYNLGVVLLFVYLFIPLGLGIKKYGLSTALSAYTVKFYCISFLGFFAFRNNPFLSKTLIKNVCLFAASFVSLFVICGFVYGRIESLNRFQLFAQLYSLFPETMHYFGVYETGGVFFTSLLFVMISSIVALSLTLFSKAGWKKRGLYFLCFFFFVFAVFQSGSRGMELGVMAGAFGVFITKAVLLCIDYSKVKDAHEKAFVKKMLFVCFGALFVFLVALVFLLAKGYFTRFFSIGSDQGVSYRLEFLKKGLAMVFSFPFFIGKGFGASGTISEGGVHLEVDALEVLIDEGFLGFALWAFIAVLIFIAAFKDFKHSPVSSVAVIFGLFALILTSQTNPYFSDFYGIFLMSLCFLTIKLPSNAEKELFYVNHRSCFEVEKNNVLF